MIRRVLNAAAYIRMSSDKQDKSPEEQRREVTALAKREGYRIADCSWYVDEGISGDEHDRPEFRRMILDAERGLVNVILTWDQDRFSRFDLLDAAEYWKKLRDSDVKIITVNQGELDFADLKSLLLATITQHANHDFLRKLAKNVCRGHRESAEEGRWVNGAAPFGYRIGPDARLIPDTDRAPLIKGLFEAALHTPVNRLARKWNDDGIRPPRASKWSYTALLNILENEAYLGTVIHGRNACGKYARVIAGDITPVSFRDQRSELSQPRQDCIVVENAHPALVDRNLWQQVQSTLQGRRTASRKPRENSYPLTGLAVCGHCGHGLYGGMDSLADGQRIVRYGCQSRHKAVALHEGCRYMLRGEALLGAVVDGILHHWFSDGQIALHQQTMLEILSARQANNSSRLEGLKKRASEIDAQLKRAEDRLLEAPDSVYKSLCKKIGELQEKRNSLEVEIGAERHVATQDSCTLAGEVDQFIQRMCRLRAELMTGDPALVRKCLNTVCQKITIWTRAAKTRNKQTGTNRKRELFKIDVSPAPSLSAGAITIYNDQINEEPTERRNLTSFL